MFSIWKASRSLPAADLGHRQVSTTPLRVGGRSSPPGTGTSEGRPARPGAGAPERVPSDRPAVSERTARPAGSSSSRVPVPTTPNPTGYGRGGLGGTAGERVWLRGAGRARFALSSPRGRRASEQPLPASGPRGRSWKYRQTAASLPCTRLLPRSPSSTARLAHCWPAAGPRSGCPRTRSPCRPQRRRSVQGQASPSSTASSAGNESEAEVG